MSTLAPLVVTIFPSPPFTFTRLTVVCCVAIGMAAGNDEPPDNICHLLPSMRVPLPRAGVHHIASLLPSSSLSPSSCAITTFNLHNLYYSWLLCEDRVGSLSTLSLGGPGSDCLHHLCPPPSFLLELLPLLLSSSNSRCRIPLCCLCRHLLLLCCHPTPDAVIFHFIIISSSPLSADGLDVLSASSLPLRLLLLLLILSLSLHAPLLPAGGGEGGDMWRRYSTWW